MDSEKLQDRKFMKKKKNLHSYTLTTEDQKQKLSK